MKIYKIAQYVSLECTDCKKSTINEGYMLKDDLWNKIATKEDNLCIDCFEKRLGRHLSRNDFMDIDYNFWEGSMKHKSPKLINRLTKNKMKIYKIAQTEQPMEYGYNLTSDSRVASVNWSEPDIQMLVPWNEEVVKKFLGLPPNAIIYATLADINDLNESLVEEEDIESSYDWSELQSRRSSPPPIVITRLDSGNIVINDGNHRVRFWREMGKQYIPSWCFDEMMTKWQNEQKIDSGNNDFNLE